MTDQPSSIEIRTFTSFAEITALPRFIAENPITKENYRRLLGEYQFPPKEEVKCCLQKGHGGLCHEPHRHGFVAELTDGSVTIVGNVCAKDKFGADAQIRADRSRYLKEKRRREYLARLDDLLTASDYRPKLAEMRDELAALQTRIAEFKAQFGPLTVRRLEDISKAGLPSITVRGVTLRQYMDDEGQPATERLAAPVKLGNVGGIALLSRSPFVAIIGEMNAVNRAYTRAESSDRSTLKNNEVELLTATISKSEQILTDGKRLLEMEAQLRSTDPSLFCFLISDKAERFKAARVAMERSGERGGKDRAKQWLSDKEKQLKSALKVDGIEIP